MSKKNPAKHITSGPGTKILADRSAVREVLELLRRWESRPAFVEILDLLIAGDSDWFPKPEDWPDLDPILADEALALLLVNEIVFWAPNGHMAVGCNDTFGWGCADSELLPWSRGRAGDEIWKLYDAIRVHGEIASAAWCAIQRDATPIHQVVKGLEDAGLWVDGKPVLPAKAKIRDANDSADAPKWSSDPDTEFLSSDRVGELMASECLDASEPTTIRVRIPVIVREDGAWATCYNDTTEQSGARMLETARDIAASRCFADSGTELLRRNVVVITADVPLPSVADVEGDIE